MSALQRSSNRNSAALLQHDTGEGLKTSRGHVHGTPSPFQNALSVHIARSASSSSLQLSTVFDRSESLTGKFSPPPLRQNSRELLSLANAARTSVAGHRKRQMSLSSLDNLAALK